MAKLPGTVRAIADKTSAKARAGVTGAADAAKANPPSPSPMTNMILADVVMRGGGSILRRAVEASLLGKALGSPVKAKRIIKGRSMTQTLVGTALARIATRSIPGALIVGGGLLAKTLYDRKRGQAAAEDGEKAVEKQARRGTS